MDLTASQIVELIEDVREDVRAIRFHLGNQNAVLADRTTENVQLKLMHLSKMVKEGRPQ